METTRTTRTTRAPSEEDDGDARIYAEVYPCTYVEPGVNALLLYADTQHLSSCWVKDLDLRMQDKIVLQENSMLSEGT